MIKVASISQKLKCLNSSKTKFEAHLNIIKENEITVENEALHATLVDEDEDQIQETIEINVLRDDETSNTVPAQNLTNTNSNQIETSVNQADFDKISEFSETYNTIPPQNMIDTNSNQIDSDKNSEIVVETSNTAPLKNLINTNSNQIDSGKISEINELSNTAPIQNLINNDSNQTETTTYQTESDRNSENSQPTNNKQETNEDSNSSNSYSIPPTPFLKQTNTVTLSEDESSNMTINNENFEDSELNISSNALGPYSPKPPKTPPQPEMSSFTAEAGRPSNKSFKKAVSFQCCSFKDILNNKDNNVIIFIKNKSILNIKISFFCLEFFKASSHK